MYEIFLDKSCVSLLEIDNMNSSQAVGPPEDQIHTEYLSQSFLEPNRTTAKRREGQNELRSNKMFKTTKWSLNKIMPP